MEHSTSIQLSVFVGFFNFNDALCPPAATPTKNREKKKCKILGGAASAKILNQNNFGHVHFMCASGLGETPFVWNSMEKYFSVCVYSYVFMAIAAAPAPAAAGWQFK